MTVLGTLLLLMAVTSVADAKELTIIEVHSRPYSFQGQRLRLCGEVPKDGSTLYSDTIYPMHGRVGIKLRGYAGRGRGQCVTGLLLRADGQAPTDAKNILVTDAPVHPEFVLVAEPS